jgi:hypothetical protein
MARQVGASGGAAGIIGWRYERLRKAGLGAKSADVLSHEGDVDLHALLELIERGCPPELAARILAPLDSEGPAC